MNSSQTPIYEGKNSVRTRLLDAAFVLFQKHDYYDVTIRQLADQANTSSAMIKYFYKSKHGLYEEMIRQQFLSIEQALERANNERDGLDLTQLFLNYRSEHLKNPDHIKFVFGTLAIKEGPGFKLMSKALDKNWHYVKRVIQKNKDNNQIPSNIDMDVFIVVLTSLAVFPYLINNVLDQSRSISSDKLYENITNFSAKLLEISLTDSGDDLWEFE